MLLEQLRTTHDQEDWFVPVSTAIDGLTAEQAMWTPRKRQSLRGPARLSHLVLGSASLNDFKGEKNPTFDGNNNETFDKFTADQWTDLVKKLNQVLADWDKAVNDARR